MNVVERNPALSQVACYRRTIGASLERVWENVHDWEHLPWLHARAFADIQCHDAGDWGWRAEVRYPGGEVRSNIELLLDPTPGVERYVTRVLDGPGAQSEIWTTLEPRGSEQTDITVEFCRALAEGEDAEAMGAGYLALYALLWDEDEQMMRLRQAGLDRLASPDLADEPIELGPIDALRRRLPLDLDAFGTRVRVEKVEGVEEGADALRVRGLVCPHLLGPLEAGEVANGEVRCPWHGYRFDLRTGRSCDGRRLRIANPAQLEIDPHTRNVRLVRRGAAAGGANAT